MTTPTTHVLDMPTTVATHVSGEPRVLAELETSRYTLAGSPSGNLRASRSALCG